MGQKPPNGQANTNTYLLTFDLEDESQAKAWQIAQDLASERKLKQVLIGLLLAVHTVQELTRRKIDLTEFMALFIAGIVTGGGTLTLPRPGLAPDTSPEELPTMFAGTADHINPLEAREVFSASMGDLFADGDEDIWDE
jgi:hypothetical protein